MFFCTRRNAAVSAIALMGSLWFSASASAVDPKLVEAAKAEGQVVVYGDPTSLPMLIEGFSKAYPEISVISATGGGWQMYNRYLTEKAAGRIIADVLYTAEDSLLTASDAGELADYRPEEAKNFPVWAAPNDAHYVATQGQLFMPMYNREALGDKPKPKDWLDFANPPTDWKQMVALSDPRNSSGMFAVVATLYQNFGAEKAGEILKGFKSLEAEMVPNMGQQVSKLETGERPVGFTNTTYLAKMMEKGVPIEVVNPPSGMVAQYSAIAVVKDAPHPNAGRLFLEYVLGEEATGLFVGKQMYSPRNGAESPKGFPKLNEVKIMPTDLRASLKDKDAIINWWKTSLGIE